LSGPPGSGKTRTALIVAEVLAEGGSVLVIDTEQSSALTYADDFTFTHLGWHPPFDPRELAATILDAGREHQVVIVDSMSHFWRGEGGTLDIAGGKFTGWKDARPAQIDMVEAVLRCPAHVLLCARSKVEHVQQVENGKHVVRKLGMAVVQDDELEYEINVAAELDMDHSLSVSKSRTVAVPVGRQFKAGHAEDFATLYRDWLAGGEPPARQEVVDELVAAMNGLPVEARRECKAEFLAQLGRPEHLRESQVAAALALVDAFTGTAPHAAVPESGDQPSEEAPVGEVVESLPAASPEPEPDDVPPAMSAAQSKRLHALLREKRGVAGPARHRVLSELVGREIGSAKDLTAGEASAAIDLLAAEPDLPPVDGPEEAS
jgi:hypothetical protein